MLVQNPATQRLRRHDEDVTPDPEYEDECHRAEEPGRYRGKPAFVVQEHEGEGGCAQPDGACDGGEKAARTQDQKDEPDEADKHHKNGRAHVRTPRTNAHIIWRIMLETKKKTK